MKIPFLSKLFSKKYDDREKRQHPRIDGIDIRFKILDPDYKTDLLEKAEMHNISLGGCCFKSEKKIPSKSHILIVLGIPCDHDMRKVEVSAEALRIIQRDTLYEIGARFFSFEKTENYKILKDYIDSCTD